MALVDFDALLGQFREALRDCQRLYLATGQQFVDRYPHLLDRPAGEFLQLMDDLHKGLLIKLYVSVMEADLRWTAEEKQLAYVLFNHVWGQALSESQLREATARVSQDSARLKWHSLVRPFVTFAPLRDHLAELGTVAMRVANFVAKCDGQVSPGETAQLQTIQAELEAIFGKAPRPREPQRTAAAVPPVAATPHAAPVASTQAVQAMQADAQDLRERYAWQTQPAPTLAEAPKSAEELLAAALAELDALVGLKNIKHEVRTLANFLKMQRARADAGLPQTQLSLHMVFVGNPGTGKTSVARIVGRIFGAMGILKRGHLVETDRSGLVAEYAGQTGPKSNQRIDEALDGVLFIDEAYSLVAETSEDAYGREAVQALLKRMEDDRNRLVVILAGYPEPMEKLLLTNPGLASRFNTNLTFDDYTPGELGRIFQGMCEQHHYEISPALRVKLLLGFQWLHEHRDERFGNGRAVRNSFENAIRRLANRIASVAPLTKELLTALHPDDIELADVPPDRVAKFADTNHKFIVACPGCEHESRVPGKFLGQSVQCKKCDHKFVAEWGEPCALP